jgi:hypothetical protein
MDQNEHMFDPSLLGVPSGAPKMIFKSMVRSSQTMHLSCAEINTISKYTETTFYMTHNTQEFHLVCQKRFSCSWYIQHKSCTYLASRLTLSPNELKRASTWPISPRISIGCAQNDFWAYPRLAQTVHLSCVKINTIPKQMKMSFYLTHVT